MGLISQAPYPLWFRYGLALPASCLRANDNPFDAGKVYRTDVVKHGFKGHMVMSAVDVFPQCLNEMCIRDSRIPKRFTPLMELQLEFKKAQRMDGIQLRCV